MGGAGRQRTEPAFLRRKAFWPIKMKYAGPRLNLRDAPKVVKMLCSPVQSGTSGHPNQRRETNLWQHKRKHGSGGDEEVSAFWRFTRTASVEAARSPSSFY